MRTIELGTTGLKVPQVAVGCMRIGGLSDADAAAFVGAAADGGANFFDHADIYGGGKCEEVFAKAFKATALKRERIILQSKCGIRTGAYDFSAAHILDSVHGSLKRLNTEYLDVLLLHRPDALAEPAEVAAAFDTLYTQGKVRHFGVSNHNPLQIQLLRRYVKQPIAANQLQLSIPPAQAITAGTHVNMDCGEAVNRDGGVLDFCRLNDITVQPWSPFQYGFFRGVYLDNAEFPALNAKIDEIARAYGVANTAVVMAWLTRHPADMQPVTGTTDIGRLKDCIKGADVRLTREQWYQIYLAAGHTLP
jgi:predicted oxidoreductase